MKENAPATYSANPGAVGAMIEPKYVSGRTTVLLLLCPFEAAMLNASNRLIRGDPITDAIVLTVSAAPWRAPTS
jgi:hypothetical protein